MFQVDFYLRCEKGHLNTIPMRERNERVGTPCATCGLPLLAQVPSPRGGYRGRF